MINDNNLTDDLNYDESISDSANLNTTNNAADQPMPDPAAANAKAREIFEQNHPNDNNDTTLQAGEDAFNPTQIKLASDRRDASSAPRRANEATDPNDTGSGGIPAGGVKSGSSLQ